MKVESDDDGGTDRTYLSGKFRARYATYRQNSPFGRAPLPFERLAEELDMPSNRLAEKAVLVRELVLAVTEARLSEYAWLENSDAQPNFAYRADFGTKDESAHSLIWPQARSAGSKIESSTCKP